MSPPPPKKKKKQGGVDGGYPVFLAEKQVLFLDFPFLSIDSICLGGQKGVSIVGPTQTSESGGCLCRFHGTTKRSLLNSKNMTQETTNRKKEGFLLVRSSLAEEESRFPPLILYGHFICSRWCLSA